MYHFRFCYCVVDPVNGRFKIKVCVIVLYFCSGFVLFYFPRLANDLYIVPI